MRPPPACVYFAAPREMWDELGPLITAALQARGVAAEVTPDCHDPAAVDYLVYTPTSAVQDFRPFTRARAVLNLWAGVDRILANPTLRQPLIRMVDPGQREGMVEYVTAHVLRHHIGMDRYLKARDWVQEAPPLARDRRVTVLGLGELGSACARALAALNFRVTGWSRRPRALAGVSCLHGDATLPDALATAEILVLLLPFTPQTENLMDAHRLAMLPRGAVVINPGRGALIDDAALVAALDRGHLAHATLDTFRVEPLPADHPLRLHPAVTISPHVASLVRPATCAEMIADNIRRGEAGEPFLHLVDPKAGY